MACVESTRGRVGEPENSPSVAASVCVRACMHARIVHVNSVSFCLLSRRDISDLSFYMHALLAACCTCTCTCTLGNEHRLCLAVAVLKRRRVCFSGRQDLNPTAALHLQDREAGVFAVARPQSPPVRPKRRRNKDVSPVRDPVPSLAFR